MIPSLRAGRYRREPRVAITWSITCSSWHAPPIAYLSTAAIHSFSMVPGLAGRGRQAAVELVDVAEVADQVEQEVDPALVEVREVDARAEDAPAGVAGVVDHAAAHHARPRSRGRAAPGRRPLGRTERGSVLGVEVARVDQLDDARAAGAGDGARPGRRRRWREAARGARAPRASARASSSTRWRPGARAREHVGGEQSLGELEALLVGEHSLALGLHLGAAGRQAGEALGRVVDEVLEAQRASEVVGERRVRSSACSRRNDTRASFRASAIAAAAAASASLRAGRSADARPVPGRASGTRSPPGPRRGRSRTPRARLASRSRPPPPAGRRR